MEAMEKSKITIEELAKMIQDGFNGTIKKDGVNHRFDRIEKKLDRIENVLIQNNTRRIEKLETGMTELREALALK